MMLHRLHRMRLTTGRSGCRISNVYYINTMANVSPVYEKKVDDMKADLRSIYDRAVHSVLPCNLIPEAVKILDGNTIRICDKTYFVDKNVYVVGFGKAVLGMAAAINNILHHHIVQGVLSVPTGSYELPAAKELENSSIEVYEGARNNLPDVLAEQTAIKITSLAKNLDQKSLLLVLISGGGSALLPSPKTGIYIQDKVEVINLLQSRGASIQELNCVRKKLSLLKGGGLARLAYPAKVVSLILSDIVGDPLDYIASGPTVKNNDSPGMAFDVIQKYNLEGELKKHVLSILLNHTEEGPCACSSYNVENIIIGNNKIAIEAAKKAALSVGILPVVLCDSIALTVAILSDFYATLSVHIFNALLYDKLEDLKMFCVSSINKLNFNTDYSSDLNKALELLQAGKGKGLCILGGGEPTVELVQTGCGLGGRSQELALRFSCQMFNNMKSQPWKNMHAVLLCAGTDGIDGPTDAAGAFGFAEQVAQAHQIDITPEQFRDSNNSYGYFSKMDGDIIKIGHTGTNVMDLHMLLIQPDNLPCS